MEIQKSKIAYDEFIVLDESDNPITGLLDSDFTKKLYDPDDNEVGNISGEEPVPITEIGSGLYRTSFTPNKLGNWILLVYNSNYFPYGKGANYKCVEYLSDDIGLLSRKILGLSQSNYRIFNPAYDKNNNMISALIKTYNNASDCDNDINPLAQYQVVATHDNRNRMTGYKVKEL